MRNIYGCICSQLRVLNALGGAEVATYESVLCLHYLLSIRCFLFSVL